MGSAEQYGGPTEADALAAWEDVVRMFTRDVQAVSWQLDMSGDVLTLILPTIDCPEFRAIFTWRFLTLVPRCDANARMAIHASNGHATHCCCRCVSHLTCAGAVAGAPG